MNMFLGAEWRRIRDPLKNLVQIRRTARLRAILESYPPPTPASVNIPVYHGPDDITGVVVGVLPGSIFLKVCYDLLSRTNAEFHPSVLGLRLPGSRDALRT